MSPIIVFGALFIAREEDFKAYSLHEGLGLYFDKSLINYTRATYHPLLYWGLMRKELDHYCIEGLLPLLRCTYERRTD